MIGRRLWQVAWPPLVVVIALGASVTAIVRSSG